MLDSTEDTCFWHGWLLRFPTIRSEQGLGCPGDVLLATHRDRHCAVITQLSLHGIAAHVHDRAPCCMATCFASPVPGRNPNPQL